MALWLVYNHKMSSFEEFLERGKTASICTTNLPEVTIDICRSEEEGMSRGGVVMRMRLSGQF